MCIRDRKTFFPPPTSFVHIGDTVRQYSVHPLPPSAMPDANRINFQQQPLIKNTEKRTETVSYTHLEQLAYPNGMTRVNTYEDSRDLLSVIDYQRPGSAHPPARHEYDYDALGRPTRRRDTWNTAAHKTTHAKDVLSFLNTQFFKVFGIVVLAVVSCGIILSLFLWKFCNPDNINNGELPVLACLLYTSRCV